MYHLSTPEQTFAQIQDLVKYENIVGQCLLGACYVSGYGVEKNDAEAIKWLRLSSDRGYCGASELLALFYFLNNSEEYQKLSNLAGKQRHAVDYCLPGAVDKLITSPKDDLEFFAFEHLNCITPAGCDLPKLDLPKSGFKMTTEQLSKARSRHRYWEKLKRGGSDVYWN